MSVNPIVPQPGPGEYAPGSLGYAVTQPQRDLLAAHRRQAEAKVAAVVRALILALHDVDEFDAARVVARLCDVGPVADSLLAALQSVEKPQTTATFDTAMLRHRLELGR